jgi:hypothetical protein
LYILHSSFSERQECPLEIQILQFEEFKLELANCNMSFKNKIRHKLRVIKNDFYST